MTGRKIKKSPELLAPAGTLKALRAVLQAGADAVYLSGKRFGMRAHRSSFHFDDDALKDAVDMVRASDARIYVTINNLLSDEELQGAMDYIGDLGELGIDAVIIQDLGLLKLLHEHPPALEIHMSTMLNVHSSAFASFLKSRGVSRIITSRDVSLAQVAEMARRTGLEMEYFIHGDMCSVESGLCHLSGVLFGQSANRGRCLKPCRWPWKITGKEARGGNGPLMYYLAQKDICLLHALPEVVESGVTSLKIEGRMRPAEFLKAIVEVYRRALDRYLESPFLYRHDLQETEDIFENRVRDFSSCHALGPRGPASRGFTGAREPRFFSSPVPEPALNVSDVLPDPTPAGWAPAPPALSVALHSPRALRAVLAEKPDWIYIYSSISENGQAWSLRRLSLAIEECRAAGIPCAVALPPVTPDREIDELPSFIRSLEPAPDAWLAGNAGQLSLLDRNPGAARMADSFFNVFNGEALNLLAEEGVVRACLSPEVSLDQLAAMARPFPLEVEYAVHGPVQAMFTEDCLIRLALDREFDPGVCRQYCGRKSFSLENEIGERYPILVTHRCRNAVFFPKHLCLLHRMGMILQAGVRSFRFNLLDFDSEQAASVVRIYKNGLAELLAGNLDWFRREDMKAMESFSPAGLWEGGAPHGVLPAPRALIPLENP